MTLTSSRLVSGSSLCQGGGLAGGSSLAGASVLALREPADLSGLYSYQKDGVCFLQQHQRCLLADVMSLGKTVQVLRALPSRPRVLVICPASVVSQWEYAASHDRNAPGGKGWRPDLVVDVESGLRAPQPGEIVVVSCDSLPTPICRPGRRPVLCDESLEGVIIVLDEIQWAMKLNSRRSRRVRLLLFQAGARAVVWLLTGTPMQGDPLALFAVLSAGGLVSKVFHGGTPILDEQGEPRLDKHGRPMVESPRDECIRLFGGTPCYARVRGKLKQTGFDWGEVSPLVAERLAAVMLRRSPEDPGVDIELPKVRHHELIVPTPLDLSQFLSEHERELLEDLEDGAPNPCDATHTARRLIAESRVEAAAAWVDQALEVADTQLLVFSAHRAPVDAIGRMQLPGGVETLTGSTPEETRGGIIERFREGRTRTLAVTIKTGGTGINLQAADKVLLVDLAWVDDANLQAIARAVRPGHRTGRVDVYTMRSDHPVELRVHELLAERRRLNEGVGLGRPRREEASHGET